MIKILLICLASLIGLVIVLSIIFVTVLNIVFKKLGDVLSQLDE